MKQSEIIRILKHETTLEKKTNFEMVENKSKSNRFNALI